MLIMILFLGLILIVGPRILLELDLIVYRILNGKIPKVTINVIQLAVSLFIGLLFIYFWRLLFLKLFQYAYKTKREL